MLLAQGEVWMYDTALGGAPQPMLSPLFWCGWGVVEVLVVIIYNSIRSSCSSCSNNNSSSSISSRSTVQAEVQVQVKVEVQVVVMMLVLVLRSSNNGSSCSTITSRITTWGPYHWRGGGSDTQKGNIYIFIYIYTCFKYFKYSCAAPHRRYRNGAACFLDVVIARKSPTVGRDIVEQILYIEATKVSLIWAQLKFPVNLNWLSKVGRNWCPLLIPVDTVWLNGGLWRHLLERSSLWFSFAVELCYVVLDIVEPCTNHI